MVELRERCWPNKRNKHLILTKAIDAVEGLRSDVEHRPMAYLPGKRSFCSGRASNLVGQSVLVPNCKFNLLTLKADRTDQPADRQSRSLTADRAQYEAFSQTSSLLL